MPIMQERATRTKRIILQAAAATFEARGYAATSLQDIASRMAVSKGALYFHFSSKEEIALAVVDEYYYLWSETLTQLRQRHPRAMRLLLELSWEIAGLARESVVMRAGLRLVWERNLIGPAVPMPFIAWINVIDGLLREARDQGDLLPGVNTERTARFIVASFMGYQQLTVARDMTGVDTTQCVNTMWGYLLPSSVNSDCLSEMRGVLARRGGGDT